MLFSYNDFLFKINKGETDIPAKESYTGIEGLKSIFSWGNIFVIAVNQNNVREIPLLVQYENGVVNIEKMFYNSTDPTFKANLHLEDLAVRGNDVFFVLSSGHDDEVKTKSAWLLSIVPNKKMKYNYNTSTFAYEDGSPLPLIELQSGLALTLTKRDHGKVCIGGIAFKGPLIAVAGETVIWTPVPLEELYY